MRRLLFILGTTLASAVLLAGCGQKGPLFVPGIPREASWPYPDPPKRQPPPPKAPDMPPTSDPER
ncbi:MAG: LPS translocon maturation chaperone LptM [Betaproteobacteria bacterium]